MVTTESEKAIHVPGDIDIERLESVARMKRDIAASASTLTREQSRFMVAAYYEMQDNRKASDQRANALDDNGQPNSVVEWLADQNRIIEQQIQRALDQFTAAQPLGQWAREQVGIGPVIAAALLAYIDFSRISTAGAIWRYAGLDPTNIWYGKERATVLVNQIVGSTSTWVNPVQLHEIGVKTNRSSLAIRRNVERLAEISESQDTDDEGNIKRTAIIKYLSRRPWNANLKLVAWKIGDSFCKTSNNPKSFYGPIYRDRKAQEVYRNNEGMFAALAAQTLEEKNITDPKTRSTYKSGKLPDGRLELRARRYAVKLFLSHFFEVGYWLHHQKAPPVPFVISRLGHVDYIPPPHIDVIGLEPWW